MASTVVPERRPPRLPLLDIHGAITRYKNELFKRKEEADQLDCETSSQDDKLSELELKCLHSLQKRKDRALSGVLFESSDFLSPRSGCLTPLSSARGSSISVNLRSAQVIAERESISLPNSSREIRDRPLGPPLQDSLRSRFCKQTTTKEIFDPVILESTKSQNKKGPLEQKLSEQGLTPVYEPKCSEGEQLGSLPPLIPDVSDLRVFLVCAGPKCGGHIQCHIRRVVSTYKLYPRFTFLS
ncbi:hypothetical protein L7F22_066814 [Adiantum nelumboides]|nr:hypothetical protein [Adiantum nelumboides]